jgi:hypothetical protein
MSVRRTDHSCGLRFVAGQSAETSASRSAICRRARVFDQPAINMTGAASLLVNQSAEITFQARNNPRAMFMSFTRQ